MPLCVKGNQQKSPSITEADRRTVEAKSDAADARQRMQAVNHALASLVIPAEPTWTSQVADAGE